MSYRQTSQRNTVAADPASWIGRELGGKWTLLRVLGAGSSSVVYEASHRNGRRAALKVVATERRQAARLATFESRIANAIDHPGVVSVLDDDVTEDGTPYLVMELLDGATLEDLRERAGGKLPLLRALPIFESMLEILGALHTRGIVHRDLKPENVFVLDDVAQVKIIDLGLAARTTDPPDAGDWFGTPGFMPPEQARAEGNRVDVRSDLWACAATFFSVLTGRLPHRATSVDELVARARRDEVELDDDGTIPLPILDVLQRALSFDPADRWPDAATMLAALRTAVVRALRPRAVGRRRAAILSSGSVTRIFRLVPDPPPTLRSPCPAESGAYPRVRLREVG